MLKCIQISVFSRSIPRNNFSPQISSISLLKHFSCFRPCSYLPIGWQVGYDLAEQFTSGSYKALLLDEILEQHTLIK
jgi:hypothetical protein